MASNKTVESGLRRSVSFRENPLMDARRTRSCMAGIGVRFRDPDAPMNPFWSQIARELSPYVPSEQPRLANLIVHSEVPY
jgi:hypothetical protein